MHSHENRLNEWNFIRLPMGAHLISIGDFLDVPEVMKNYVKKESSNLAKAPEEGQATVPNRNPATSGEG